jgi:hypothetical protein
MSDQQFDEVERLAKQKHIDLRECPTCESRLQTFEYDDDEAWPEAPTYRYLGKEHVCDCLEQDKLRRHYLLANIPVHYWRLGPEEYFGDASAWDVMEGYLDRWKAYRNAGIGMEFHSPTMGTGKTFLATYIARELVKKCEPVFFTRFRDIMGLYDRPYEARKALEERLWYTRVLLLDEVGAPLSEAQGAYFASEFESVIRARIDDDRVTIMTTNLQPDELDRYYPRTYGLLAAKQQRHEINFRDVRRSGDVLLLDAELAANGETRPIV